MEILALEMGVSRATIADGEEEVYILDVSGVTHDQVPAKVSIIIGEIDNWQALVAGVDDVLNAKDGDVDAG